MKIVLGITGSIAAYKSADIAHSLYKQGHEVTCVLTKAGAEFITPMTLQSLSKRKVYTDLFAENEYTKIAHVALAQADVILVAPASADFIAKVACGLGDDILSAILIAADPKKVIMAPAMNVHMYENPIVARNIKVLKDVGVRFIEPKEAVLACDDKGKGALADVAVITDVIDKFFSN